MPRTPGGRMSVPTIEDQTSAESLKERGKRLLERRMHRPLANIVPERRRHRRVLVTVLGSLYKRDRIANLLTWLINQKSLGLGEERKHERVVPRINASKLILPNGEVHNCRVIHVSWSGASVACAVKPPTGTVVILGRMRGRVVRHHDQGIALQFVELQDPDSLARRSRSDSPPPLGVE